MISNPFKNFRQKYPSPVTIPLGILLTGICLMGASLYSYKTTDTSWESFVEERNTLYQLHDELILSLGYGGFIHHFKNLVLRRDRDLYEQPVLASLTRAKLAMAELKARRAYNPESISVIESTISEYEDNLKRAAQLINEGATPEHIDAEVRVDDSDAFVAINQFESSMKQQFALEEQVLASKLLFSMMIHAAGSLLFIGIIAVYFFNTGRARARERQLTSDLTQSLSVRSGFLSSMSHELRTPMNAVLGFSQLLELDKTLSHEQRENVQEIVRAGEHLLELINDVLDLAAIESGKVKIVVAPVDLTTEIRLCASLLRATAQENRIAIHYDPAEHPVVNADRLRLRQVLINLLSNAIKYNNEGGEVSINVKSETADRVTIEVSDTGFGISDDQLKRVFEPFNRLDAVNGPVAGTGIGLAISKDLVEMMGGRIDVQSVKGTGSVFSVTLSRVFTAEQDSCVAQR